tara:strand:- start:1089 stop:1277 length:189 start_codon:yes stop_codon:yes gene_type:complete
MSTREERATETVKMALDNAIKRLTKIKGADRIALTNEFKEWIETNKVDDDVWFSTDKSMLDS